MACEHCVTRRDFLSRTAATAGLGVLAAACGDGQLSGILAPSNSGGGPLVITVANFPGLANVGELVKVGTFQAAKRTGTATFDAFDMTCTHQRCLTQITNGQRFDCPCHGSAFSSTGAVINPPATAPLTRLTTSYNPANDQLTIG